MNIIRRILAVGLAVASTWCVAGDMSEATQAVARLGKSDTELKVLLQGSQFVVMEGVTGVLPPKELQRLDTPLFGVGNAGIEVRAIQAALAESGAPLRVDGIFGQKTRDAVKAYQTAHGLAMDGVVGGETWSALELPRPLLATWRRSERMTLEAGGRRYSYRVSRDLEISRLESNDGNQSWSRRVFVEVGRDEREKWPAFLATLLPLGLQSYTVVKEGEASWVEVTLHQASGNAWPLGQGVLTLPAEVYEHLRIAKDYEPRRSTSGKYVVLIHEPHSDTAGQVQMVEGLDAMLRANKARQFKFLVEGQPPEQGEDIPIEPVRRLLSDNDRIRRMQVHHLLRHFVIDGPLAYRLIYGDVPSVAIDDRKAVNESPKRSSVPSRLELDSLLRGVAMKLRVLPIDKATAVGPAFSGLVGALRLNIKGTDQGLVDLFEKQAAAADQLAQALERISPTDFSREIAELKRVAGEFGTEKEAYRLALVRNEAMSKYIKQHHEGKDRKLLPIAFIGNFHTLGIIKMLPQDMGYVVLEPRVDAAHSREEHAKFEDALHDYRTALTRAKRSLLKMRVLPPEAALPDIKAIVDGVAKRASESRDVLGNDLGRDVTGPVRQAMDRNGFFTQSDLVVAGASGRDVGGPPKPPQGFESAFASFERGGGGSSNGGGGPGPGGTFRLFPGHGGGWDSAARDRWREGSRLAFLRQAVLPVPLEESDRKGLVARKVTFFQDPASKVVFVSVFDRDQNAYYFFQSDGSLDGLRFLALPPGRSEAEIHFRQAELLLRIREGKHRG